MNSFQHVGEAFDRSSDQLADLLFAKWNVLILRCLKDEPKRFTDLRALLPAISAKVLTAKLRELQVACLIRREELSTSAAGNVYDLAAGTRELIPALDEIFAWTSAQSRRSSVSLQLEFPAEITV